MDDAKNLSINTYTLHVNTTCYLCIQVSVGFSHIVAVNNEHMVYSWGENSHGQLGHGDTKSRGAPEMIEALKGRPILR